MALQSLWLLTSRGQSSRQRSQSALAGTRSSTKFLFRCVSTATRSASDQGRFSTPRFPAGGRRLHCYRTSDIRKWLLEDFEGWLLPDFGGTHLLLCALDAGGLTGRGVAAGGLFFRGGRPGPFFFFTTSSVFSFTSSFSSSASESSEKESAELPDMTAGKSSQCGDDSHSTFQHRNPSNWTW